MSWIGEQYLTLSMNDQAIAMGIDDGPKWVEISRSSNYRSFMQELLIEWLPNRFRLTMEKIFCLIDCDNENCNQYIISHNDQMYRKSAKCESLTREIFNFGWIF